MPADRKRLRQISKQCVNYGQRVQILSLNVCWILPSANCSRQRLCAIMDPKQDSLRFYYLGKRYENKIEHFGCKQTYLPEEPMILECAKEK